MSESSTLAKRYGVSQRIGDSTLVLSFRHEDPLAADRFEDEDDGAGAGPLEGKESVDPDGRKWKAAPGQKEKGSRAPPCRVPVSEKVIGLVSCRYLAL